MKRPIIITATVLALAAIPTQGAFAINMTRPELAAVGPDTADAGFGTSPGTSAPPETSTPDATEPVPTEPTGATVPDGEPAAGADLAAAEELTSPETTPPPADPERPEANQAEADEGSDDTAECSNFADAIDEAWGMARLGFDLAELLGRFGGGRVAETAAWWVDVAIDLEEQAREAGCYGENEEDAE